MSKSFIKERLIEAQQMGMKTNVALAEYVGVTPMAVSKWSKGINPPKGNHLSKLAQILNVPESFFFKREKLVNLEGQLQFRSRASRGKKETLMVTRIIEYSVEAAEKLISSYDLPQYEQVFGDFDPLTLSSKEVEQMARDLRNSWGLGNSPIKTLGNLLFNKGIILLRAELPKRMDGFSFFVSGTPFIVIRDCEDDERSRDKMTIAHELGHIIMHHSNLPNGLASLNKEKHDKVERDAYRLGGAFLMPPEDYLRGVYAPTIDCLLQQKSVWQVSVAAQIRRLYDLGEISKDKYGQLSRQMNYRGMGKKEKKEEVIFREMCDQLDRLKEKLQKNRKDIWQEILNECSNLPYISRNLIYGKSNKAIEENIIDFRLPS